MLVSFLLGGVLGVIGLLSTDGSGFLEYILSEENLKAEQLILSGDPAIYLNVCFNGNYWQ